MNVELDVHVDVGVNVDVDVDINVDMEMENPEFKNKDLHVQSQRLILNIYDCIKNEMRNKSEN